MPQTSEYVRLRMFALSQSGLKNKDIGLALQDENISVCRQTIWRFKKHFRKYGSIAAVRRSGRTSITGKIASHVEESMRKSDETTAKQLVDIVQQRTGMSISKSTVLRTRNQLGWSYRGAAYCQMIREVNRQKRYQWALKVVNDDFKNVIWTDETTVQLETHKRFCCRKKGEVPKCKPRPKHPVKVHVWGGISCSGRTKLCIFKGIMTTDVYIQILETCLIPSIDELFPNGSHRFMQDNDPKHTSKKAREFFAEKGVNWWHTPPESPDTNPIENLWHEMKVMKCTFSFLVLYFSILLGVY